MAKSEVTNDEIMTALTQFATSVDKRFDEVDKRFDDVNRHSNGIEERLDRLEEGQARLQDDVNRIYGILDAHMKRIERIIEENSVQLHQQARLERWIFQLADEAGVKLKYE